MACSLPVSYSQDEVLVTMLAFGSAWVFAVPKGSSLGIYEAYFLLLQYSSEGSINLNAL